MVYYLKTHKNNQKGINLQYEKMLQFFEKYQYFSFQNWTSDSWNEVLQDSWDSFRLV